MNHNYVLMELNCTMNSFFLRKKKEKLNEVNGKGYFLIMKERILLYLFSFFNSFKNCIFLFVSFFSPSIYSWFTIFVVWIQIPQISPCRWQKVVQVMTTFFTWTGE